MTTSTEANAAAPEPVNELVARLRRTWDSGLTRPYAWRVGQLRRLGDLIRENEQVLFDALRQDLGKPAFEAWASAPSVLLGEIAPAREYLPEWMKPQRAEIPLVIEPARAYVQPEPLGVALIIAPWNYPLSLALAPLVGALAAGNCAVIKPSEIAPATSKAITELVPRYLDRECIAVVQGGVAETTALLAERFDHVFYTGNGTVGRIVMTAAARHLTPVTLELGGKSPCIVDSDVDLKVAGRRIAWGKFFNAGQTCVAPDYVLVPPALEQPLLEEIKQAVTGFFGAEPKGSPDYGRIVSARHHERLSKLLASGEVVVGGHTDPATRYIAPTVLRNVAPDSPVMADEIFGPILPVLTVPDVDAAIAFVNARPKPLALYVFSKKRGTVEKVLERTSSGGVCVNDTVTHLLPPDLPFGGVGPSGMGAYHGKASFDTFTHYKSVLDRSTWLDPDLRYPPYSDNKLKWARRVM